MVEVINLRTCKDWGKPGDVKIDRTTKWGNPFKLSKYTREQSLKLYEPYFVKTLLQDLDELSGAKRLGCFCKPLACHGDIIKKYLESNTIQQSLNI
jgi:hypothetical protein